MVLIIPDTYLVSILAQSGGQDVVNVIGVRMPGGTAIAVATAVSGAWKATNGPLSVLPTQYKMIGVKAMSLATANGDIYQAADSAQGIGSGQLATNGSCALVTFGSGTRAKSERGRMYMGPLREGQIGDDGRSLVSPQLHTAAMQVFKTNLEVANRQWVVVSRKYSIATQVSQISTQTIIGTQRRRIR